MYVTVTDQAGAPVTGLTAADFVVREDGVQREVLRVEPATEPIEITLLVDTSAATSPYVADIRRALKEFVKQTAKGNDVAVTAFGARPQVMQSYTRSPELLNRAIDRLFPEQGTGAYLLDALKSVASGIAKRAPERAAIVAVAVQAAPEFSDIPKENVVTALRECGAVFDVVLLTTGAGTPEPTIGERAIAMHDRDMVLDQGTRATGGVNEQALSGMALTPELERISAQLRNQYRLVYSRPESLIPPERIEVTVKKPALTARGTPVKAPRTTERQHE
jgi:VWFA-related protein